MRSDELAATFEQNALRRLNLNMIIVHNGGHGFVETLLLLAGDRFAG